VRDTVTDPALIDWPARQAAAAIAFEVIDGRPVNPCEHTGVRGRNRMRRWGENLAADAMVTVTDEADRRWLLMVERRDGNGWALPGGHVDPGESPAYAAVRELAEETGVHLPGRTWRTEPARYVPDPRASDEAWMVTVLSRLDLGRKYYRRFPRPVAADDAARAMWMWADSYGELCDAVDSFGGVVFPAHVAMLRDALAAH
jgi:8-oxo-dGTP pyrophosphatase MutT (NUDIX family)